MASYKVIHPCKVAGQIHKPGAEPVDAEPKAVKALVASGALKAQPAKSDKKQGDGK